MTSMHLLLAWIFVIGIQSQIAFGDLLWLKDSSSPVSGLLKKQEESGDIVWLASNVDSDLLQERKFVAVDVERILTTVDIARLENLSTGNLNAMRDYAEELAATRADSFARKTAFRLFLFCVHHGFKQSKQNIVDSALKNLVHLAENRNDRMAFQRLQLLYSSKTNINPPDNPTIDSTNPKDRELILQLIQALRQNQFDVATRIFNGFDANSKKTVLPPSLAKSTREAIAGKSLELSLKKDLIEMEYYLRFEYDTQVPFSITTSNRWTRENSGVLKFVNIEELSPFDLSATQFKEYTWTMPDKP